MKKRVIRLPVLVLPVLALGFLQLPGCTGDRLPPAPPGGVYRSTSAGASFDQAVNIAGQAGEYIAQFELFSIFRAGQTPDNIYVAAGNNGLVESRDDGETWSVIATPLAQTLDVLLLKNGALVASGTDDDGQGYVVRSLDGGASWQTVFTVPVPLEVKRGLQIIQGASPVGSVVLSIELDPFNGDRIYAGSNLGTIFVGEQSAKLWKTIHTITNTGFNPTAQAGGASVQKIIPSPHTPGEVIVVTKQQTLLRVSAGKQEEIKVPQYINTPPPFATGQGQKKVSDMAYIPQFPQAMLVGVEDGIVVTRDSGQSWIQLGLPVEPSQVFNSIVVAVSPTNVNRLLTAINNVVYRSEDGGQTWNTFSLGLPAHVITALSINPSNAGRVLLIANRPDS